MTSAFWHLRLEKAWMKKENTSSVGAGRGAGGRINFLFDTFETNTKLNCIFAQIAWILFHHSFSIRCSERKREAFEFKSYICIELQKFKSDERELDVEKEHDRSK